MTQPIEKIALSIATAQLLWTSSVLLASGLPGSGDCGTGDSSSCIQNVIDTNCVSGSVTVSIGTGTVDIDNNISIPANCYEVIIEGVASDSSILELSTSLPEAFKIQNSGMVSHDLNLTLKEVTLSGNSQTVTNGGIYCSGYGDDSYETKLRLQNAVISGFVKNGSPSSPGGAGIYAKAGCDVNITGSTLKNNTTGYYGGAIHLRGEYDSLSLESGSVISGNSASKGGGGIYSHLAEVRISDSSIMGNTVTNTLKGGGGLYYKKDDIAGASNLKISNSTISGNTATRYGGGVKIEPGSYGFDLYISGSTFTDNNTTESPGYGGAIWAYKTAIHISGSSDFSRNNTDGKGGAIYQNQDSLTISGATFTDNNATDGGGAVCTYTPGYSLKVTNSTFSGNKATGNKGGAILQAGSGTVYLNMNTVTFDQNYADGKGGAISVSGGSGTDVSLNAISFTSNYTKSSSGGAIYVAPPTSFEMNSSTLSGNHAKIDGGAIATDSSSAGGSVKLYGNTLTGNYSTNGNGGALYAYRDNVKIQSCLFSGNTVNNTGSKGGAVYVSNMGYSLDINRSTFTANKANNGGGAVYSYKGNVSITESNLTVNVVTAGYGGALFSENTNGVTIQRSLFSGNTATVGGGAIKDHTASGQTFEVSNSTFSGNIVSAGKGGAILSENAGTTNAKLSNLTFYNNTASTDGAALYAGTYLTLVNAIFANNHPTSGKSCAGTGGMKVSIASNIFDETNPDCNASGTVSGNSYQSSASNVINTTLADHGGPTYTYALASGSPALDAGNSSVVTLSTYDQRGVGYLRNVGTTVDIGAYEYSLDVTALSPTDGEANLFCHEFNCAPMLVMDFSEDVSLLSGDSVDVRVVDTPGGDFMQELSIGNGDIMTFGSKVYINVKAGLEPSTDYYVSIDSNVIQSYAGISDTTTWNFTTKSWLDSTSGPISEATGYFIDGRVEGLTYICGTKRGTTGSDGAFTYDHECTFTLGNSWFYVPLSDLQATQSSGGYVTPYTVFPGDTQRVSNLACLLQAFDHDDDLSNGIQLDSSGLSNIDFLDFSMDTASFVTAIENMFLDSLYGAVDANDNNYSDRNITYICANAKINLDASIAALATSTATSGGGGGGGGTSNATPPATNLSDILGGDLGVSSDVISVTVFVPSGSEVDSGDDSTVIAVKFELEGTDTVSGVTLTIPINVTQNDGENGNVLTVAKVTVTDKDGNIIGENELSAPPGSQVKPYGSGLQISFQVGEGGEQTNVSATTNADGEISITLQKGDSSSAVSMPVGSHVNIGQNGDVTSSTTVNTSLGTVRVSATVSSGGQTTTRFTGTNGSFQSSTPTGAISVVVTFVDYSHYRSTVRRFRHRALTGVDLNALKTQFTSDRAFTVFEREDNSGTGVVVEDNSNNTNDNLAEYLMTTDLTEANSVEVSPVNGSSRFEDVTRFDGVRTVKLLSGNVNIAVDGVEKRMMPGLTYELPPTISDEVVEEEMEIGNDNATGDALFEGGIFYLNKGWNLITSPIDANLTVPDVSVSWKYQSNAWEKSSATLEPRLGYWIQLPEETELDLGMNGVSYQPTYSQLTSGWHLVGTGKNLSYVQNATTVSEVWVYDREGTWSLNPSIIYAGQGFWIRRE